MPGNPPAKPKLYYITHMDNLQSICGSSYLYSYAQWIKLELNSKNIGMSHIKDRRLKRHQVKCHPGTTVGQYVPFYFCSRSFMLYIIHKANHLDLAYRGGQQPIVHLQIDMKQAIEWAETSNHLWAFSDRSAASNLASFYSDIGYIDQIDWNAVNTNDWQESEIQDRKQAEFLIYDSVAWSLVEKIGVIDRFRANQVAETLKGSDYIPEIAVERSWYY